MSALVALGLVLLGFIVGVIVGTRTATHRYRQRLLGRY